MARRPPPASPVPVAWVQIEGDGAECVREGFVWCDGPAVRGMRTLWAAPSAPLPGETSTVLVATPGRRVRAGRAAPGDGYALAGGRWIDKGEAYAESDPRSLLGEATRRGHAAPVPRSVAGGRIPAEALAFFVTLGGGPAGDARPGLVAADAPGAVDALAERIR